MHVLLLSIAACALVGQGVALDGTTNETQAAIAWRELYYNYDRSPPFYPSPPAPARGPWAEAYERARTLVANMTNAEKENATFGYVSSTNGCSGNSGPVNRLGFPGLCLNDGPAGVRGTEGVSGFASGIHVGASWNRNLTLWRARYMGAEYKAKGVSMALGPAPGAIGRLARGGRNWEGFSNDPYLMGVLTADTVIGLQEHVIACTKHIVANEQETNRLATGLNASISSNIDDRTMHELYLWPFADAVHAGTGSMMCSFNRINGSYGCQNSAVLNGLLKTDLGFEGFVVSDWFAQDSGVASANAGLDMAMPNSPFWGGGNITSAVANGSVEQTRLDDMVTRIVAAWYKFNPEENPGFGIPVNLSLPHTFTNARDPASKDHLLQEAIEGHVLVKNTNKTLPLIRPASLSIFGWDARTPQKSNHPIVGFGRWALGFESLDLNEDDAPTVFPTLNRTTGPLSVARNGTLIAGGGSGSITPPYISAPLDAILSRAHDEGIWVQYDTDSVRPIVNPASAACLVFINAYATEAFDMPSLTDADSDELVTHVASRCNNTVVVVHNAGIRLVDPWIDNPNVTAVVLAHLPGQDSGRAVAALLFGDVSFSGRLPYTLARSEADYGDLLAPDVPDAESDYYLQSNFTEGVYIDYKSFISRGVEPRFPFGFGLTYSEFRYRDLRIEVRRELTELPPDTDVIEQGGHPSLWEDVVCVYVTVCNSGDVKASEVPQLYLGVPVEGAPEKQLRGFAKEEIEPGREKEVEFKLRRRDVSYWDVVRQEWALVKGREYRVCVGKDVGACELEGTFTL